MVRLQAQKGFGAAVKRWDGRVADLIATKRGVISEAAYDLAVPSLALLGTAEEVRAATDRMPEELSPQVQWHNDGVYALSPDDFTAAVKAGVALASQQRLRQLSSPGMVSGAARAGAPAEPIALNDASGRAREIARDAARYAAVAALSSKSSAEIAESGEALAMDAAAAAIQALPTEICDELDEDEQAEAVVGGAGEALREKGYAPGESSTTAAAGEPTTAPPPGAPAGQYAGPGPGFFGKAGAAVGPAAGKAAGGARITQQRLAVAAKVKSAVDAKLPEAAGYGLSKPESDRAYAAARSAALEYNDRIGSPFTPQEAARIADITTTTIITTWYAVGHLQRSGASEAVGGMAKDAARRLLGSPPLPPTLIDYLVDREVPDYYELLEVSPKASHDVIEKAWRVLIAQSHPDTGGDPVRAAELNAAREILLDPDARRAYDQENGF